MNKFAAVLIVETDDLIKRLFAKEYPHLPVETYYTVDAPGALAVMEQHKIDLVIINQCDGEEECFDLFDKLSEKRQGLQAIVLLKNDADFLRWINLSRIHLVPLDGLHDKFVPVFNQVLQNMQLRDTVRKIEVERNRESEWVNRFLQEQKIFFLVSNREGKVIRGNRETMQLLRYSEEESATLQIGDLLENGFRVWKYLLDKLDSGKELFYEYLLFQDADGERSALNVRIYRITVPGSEQLIAIEGELPGRDPIPESNALQVLEIFADRIANEVLNPLNIIQGRIQLLSLTPAADEKIVHACSVLERNANRIQQSMEQLLRFARLRVDTVPQKIEISKILQMAADEWARRSDKNYPVKVKTPPKTAVHITGAETHLDALILGVLDFIQREVPGDEPVEMSGDATKAEIRIIIETGRTASPAHLEKLLTVPFYDPQEGDVRAGIGETIIQVVLQRYNAALKVEAADGDGIRINLCFPTE